MKNRNAWSWVPVYVLMTWMASSCAVEEEYVLNEHSIPSKESPAMEYVRSLQMLRYSINGVEYEKELGIQPCLVADLIFSEYNLSEFCNSLPSELEAAISNVCATSCSNQEEIPSGEDTACSKLTCDIERVTCVVNEILDLTTLTTVKKYQISEESELLIHPQTFATRAGLREIAFQRVVGGSLLLSAFMGSSFFSSTVLDFPNSATDCEMTREEGGLTWLESMEIVAKELTQIANESAQQAASDYVAIADGMMGRHALLSMNVKDNRDVRAHAAHILGGGGGLSKRYGAFIDHLDLILEEEENEVVIDIIEYIEEYSVPNCASAPLDTSERRALSIIRESGISPLIINASPENSETPLSIEQVIAGNAGENIKNRIVALRNLGNEISTMNAEEFVAYFGLELSDFRAARMSMIEENKIFARSTNIVMDRVIESYPGDQSIYAATSNPPYLPHWGYYASLVTDHGWKKVKNQVSSAEEMRGFVSSIGFGTTDSANISIFQKYLNDVIHKWASYGDPNASASSYEKKLYDFAVRFRSSVSSHGVAYFGTSYDDVEEISKTEWMAGVRNSSHKHALATSLDSLECATKGLREGVSCRGEDLGLMIASDTIPSSIPVDQVDAIAAEGEVYKAIYFGKYDVVEKHPVFVLRSKDPTGNALGAGEWEVMAVAVVFPVEVEGAMLTRKLPLEPWIFQAAGNIMTPSTEWCARPSVHCAETFDSRIPLEDELTDDGSQFENSWRRYLSLAREAAEFADALGQEARQASLVIDETSQGALTELQELCGAVVSLDPLRKCEGSTCTDSMSPEEILRENLIIADSKDINRLSRCLGEKSRLEFAVLGDTPLCAWTINGVSSTLCQLDGNDTTTLECPRVPDTEDDAATGGCRAPIEDSVYQARKIGEKENELLRIYSRPDDDLGEISKIDCNDVRRMREGFVQGDSLQVFTNAWNVFYIPNSGGKPNLMWLPQNLDGLAKRLRWEAKPGNFSSVYSGSNTLASTGDFMVGSSKSGICAPLIANQEKYKCGGNYFENAIFCNIWECDNEDGLDGRRQLNARLARASFIARLLAGITLNDAAVGFVLPKKDGSAHQGSLQTEYNAINNGNIGSRVSEYRQTIDDITTIYYKYAYGNSYLGNSTQGFYEFVKSNGLLDLPGMSLLTFMKNRGLSILTLAAMSSRGVPLSSPVDAVFGIAPHLMPFEYGLFLEDAVSDITESEPIFSMAALFDTLELICEATQSNAGSRFGCGDPKPIESREQIFHTTDQVECLANRVRDLGSRMVLFGLPESTLDSLREVSSLGAVPADGGGYAQSISRIRQRLISLNLIPGEIESQLSGIARDVRRIANELERSDIQDSINKNDLRMRIADRTESCATASLKASDTTIWGIGGGLAAAAVTCANSVYQITGLLKNARSQVELIDTDRERLLIDLEESMAGRVEALQSLGKQLLFEVEGLDAELSNLEDLRLRARRALYRGLFMDDPDVQKAFSLEGAQRQRLNTAQVRYENARRDAIRMGFMAKRAIEQRFGVWLATLSDSMTLVEPPSSWEGQICTMDGMRIPLRGGTSGEDPSAGSSDYANGFIGDWVRKLERFVESYRIDYPFSDGADTAVISVRDDIVGSRASCEVWTGNLFFDSNNLRSRGEPEDGLWSAGFCTEYEPGISEPNCVAVHSVEDDTAIQIDMPSVYGHLIPFRIHFGPPHESCLDPMGECPCSTSSCGFNEDVLYGQQMVLDPGIYQVSYYARSEEQPYDPENTENLMVVRRVSDLSDMLLANHGQESKGNEYTRHWYTVRIAAASEYFVGMRSPDAGGDAILDVAGMSIASLSSSVQIGEGEVEPPPFAATNRNGMRHVPVCEDTEGVNFRREAWRRNCAKLCDRGFSQGCADNNSTEYCYWETDFYVSQRSIDRGKVFSSSGFARGNFNYRIDNISLNFVGSAARVCVNPLLPSTCYNAGWVPYSLEHRGPYTVLNNFGEEYDAPLFTGRIEHARGLAVERYLSNPMSGADQSLISQYTTNQFRGRPLTGWYVLKVWDEPGVNFEGIEDIQLVLNYRYWTRQN